MLASSFDSSGNVTGTITLTGSKAHIMRNNIGFPTRTPTWTGSTPSSTRGLEHHPDDCRFCQHLGHPCTGSREADGSMPAACTMLHLAAGSKMIDKGTNVGLPYAGTAPDLGAYEYGAATTTAEHPGAAAAAPAPAGARAPAGASSAVAAPLGVAASLAAAARATAAALAAAAAQSPAVAQSAAAARQRRQHQRRREHAQRRQHERRRQHSQRRQHGGRRQHRCGGTPTAGQLKPQEV